MTFHFISIYLMCESHMSLQEGNMLSSAFLNYNTKNCNFLPHVTSSDNLRYYKRRRH